MSRPITRRRLLRNVAAAGGTAMGRPAFSQENPIHIAGQAVAIALTPVSRQTVRITIQPLENGRTQPVPIDGALIKENWGQPAARLRALSHPRTIQCGEFALHISPNPLTIRVQGTVQELTFDPETGTLSFDTGESPLFGLGQGGPQFDRRGNVDRMNSGQGGYQLSTHGGKVPIQFLIGSSGWAIYIHQPLGVFDLTGK